MNDFRKTTLFAGATLLLTVLNTVGLARADDVPSPCPALKRIVAARPGGFMALASDNGTGIAQPYGSASRCEVANGAYRCEWTPRQDAETSADALEGVAADIASCLPDATHDVNSPVRQHFYIGDRGNRTQITTICNGSWPDQVDGFGQLAWLNA